MHELKFKELSVEQKIGMVTCALFEKGRNPENDEYVYDLIRKHALGCVWVNHGIPDFKDVMAKLKETADYPLLIITDAESVADTTQQEIQNLKSNLGGIFG